MANLTVKREIEVKVNMNQLVYGQALLEITNNNRCIDDFNRYANEDKVKIDDVRLDLNNLFTEEIEEDFDGEKYTEYKDYIEESLEKQNCILKIRVIVEVKAKKYEVMVDSVVEKYRKYLEEVLPSYANIAYARLNLMS